VASNGCGAAGGISRLWRWLTGGPPPWEACCNEHDLAYEQGGPAAWRAWADALLRDCMIRRGWPVRAWAYWLVVRALGWAFWKR